MSVDDLDHREADDLVAHLEPLLELLDDDVLAFALVSVVHYGVVQGRIEGLTHRLDLRDAEPREDVVELRHYHLDALAVGLVGGGLLERAHEVVVHGQELVTVSLRTSLYMFSRSR